MIVAVVGDSISAGSPLWDPDPSIRARIAHPDERSQWQWWANATEPRLEFRTRAAYGKRTDEIAAFVDDVAPGAEVLVVQGGINDVAQGRPVDDAAREIACLNELVHAIESVTPLPFHDALAPLEGWSDDGDHPSVDGHRVLGELAARVLLEAQL